jgi:hypothetical protein
MAIGVDFFVHQKDTSTFEFAANPVRLNTRRGTDA